MQRTRRGLLGVTLGIGVAGCVGVDGVEYPEQGAAEESDGTIEAAEETADAGDAFEDDGRENEALAAATRRVVDDAVWFATRYEWAIETYRDAVGDVVGDVEDVHDTVTDEETVTVELADRLSESGMEAAEVAGNVLSPHFTPRSRIEARTEEHVELLRLFAERDDVDRFLEELDRMRSGFAGIGTRIYVETAFSRDPIHNRLLRRILHPLPSEPELRNEVLDSTLVELAVASDGLSTFAHRPYDRDRFDREETPRFYGGPIGSDRRAEARARFGPVVQPDERTAELFFVFRPRPQPNDDPEEVFEGWTDELPGTTVYVQRYPDADTAHARLDAATAAGNTEDVEPIDPELSKADGRDAATHWHRFFHHEARGDRYAFDDHAGTQYGYVVRAGEFLLATGFSGDAWEERFEWHGKLTNGWAIV